MTQKRLYRNGTVEVDVPYGEYIIIGCYGDPCKVYYLSPRGNVPQTYYFQQDVDNDTVTLGTFSEETKVRIDAGADYVDYNVGSSPTITNPVNGFAFSEDPAVLDGLDDTQGGAINITGGTSSTAANAGGAVTLTGGTPGATGVGGAVSITSGAGGATSGASGAVTIASGTATANSASGAVTMQSGAGAASAAAVVGGASGAVTVRTQAGGANTGGATGQAGGAAGALAVTAGVGGATNSTGAHAGGAGGAITITPGAGGAASAGTGNGGAGGALTMTSGIGGTTTAGTVGASGAIGVTTGAGAASAVAVAAGTSGALTLATGAGGANTGGASGLTGGAAGALSITGGVGGATNSTGAHAAGAGADVSITAGTGGAATAGTGNGGAGGSVTITPGAGGATIGGTAGVAGVILHRGLGSIYQGAPAAKTVSATLTAAEMITGIITINQGSGAATAQQLPLATAMDTALPDFAANDAFDFSVINISTTAADVGSVTTNTGWTLVGNMLLAANTAVTDISQGRFRARKTGAGAWTLYRIA